MVQPSVAASCIAILCIGSHRPCAGFRVTSSHNTYRAAPTTTFMGLYDEPLPPPPPPKDNDENSEPGKKERRARFTHREKDFGPEIDPENEEMYERQRLFEYDMDGEEINDLLPPLSRTLRSGVPCYFEPTDRQAIAVIKRTECHPLDACWALEAHEGKIVDSCMAISIAQRKRLEEGMALPEDTDDVDWDDELQNLLKKEQRGEPELGTMEFELDARPVGKDGLEERKRRIEKRDAKDNFKRFMEGGKKDERWLPGKPNPNPVDDEPWFTG